MARRMSLIDGVVYSTDNDIDDDIANNTDSSTDNDVNNDHDNEMGKLLSFFVVFRGLKFV
jgi:hypothetical protein